MGGFPDDPGRSCDQERMLPALVDATEALRRQCYLNLLGWLAVQMTLTYAGRNQKVEPAVFMNCQAFAGEELIKIRF